MEEENKLTEESYINAQRTLDLIMFGPIEDVYNTVNLIAEYELIQEKKSKLSRRCRDRVKGIVENARLKFEEDSKNGNQDRWNSMQKLLNITMNLNKYVRNS